MGKETSARTKTPKQPDGQGSLFSTVHASKIPDVLYKQMVSLITSGQIRPGERFPSERDLALELGVSRQSVREAIYRAKAAGLIEVKQGGGTFVISSLRGNLKLPLSMLLEGQAEKIFEFLEIRKLIESWCAEKASSAALAADLKRIEGTLKRMHKAKLATGGWEKADLDFHSAIAAATHNVLAMHIMEGLKESFHEYFRAKKFTTRSERKDSILKQHERIFEAVREKNPREARKRALEHLVYVEKMITEDFGKAE
ncbi:MAG: FadR family transcriptional regulator [Desulfobacteraceae bacterium]|nr:MAG: FadR family transcriptional regulator [Desulfobacteraceae bacterium]